MTDNTIEWQNDKGDRITVTADAGTLYASIQGDEVEFDHQRAEIDRVQGMDVVDCGIQTDTDGETFHAYLRIGDRKAELEQLAEDSKSTEPLTYEVVEQTKTIRVWGQRKERVELRLSRNKSFAEMTDREQNLDLRIDTEHDIPEDAAAGDVFAPEELVDDPRTAEERDEDALDEAAETGEDVVVRSWMENCDGSAVECSTDLVKRVATPGGEIETRRIHTH